MFARIEVADRKSSRRFERRRVAGADGSRHPRRQEKREHYLIMKRFEAEKYRQHASEWEVRQYLELA
jgi:hypothetical protein